MRLYIAATNALGIGAASFASGEWVRGMGTGNGSGERERVRDLGAGVGCASKDIAESPTAIAGTPKLINSSQYIIVVRFLLF